MDQRATKEPDTIQRVTQERDEARAELCNVAYDLTRLRKVVQEAQDVLLLRADRATSFWEMGKAVNEVRDMLGAAMPKSLNVK